MGSVNAHPPSRCGRTLYQVAGWSSKSQTAKAVLAAVHGARKDIYLVGMIGGYQCFSSDEPEPGTGVVYVDLNARLGVKVRGPHGGRTTVPLHNNIALLHEFGHAKQWIENPMFFSGGVQNTRAFAGKIKDAAFNRARDKAPDTMNYGQKRRFATDRLKLTGLRITAPAWSVRIETDNLHRHEWPICKEMGYPQRQYTDLVLL